MLEENVNLCVRQKLYCMSYFPYIFLGELELICIGPLTNAAMAIRMDPTFGTRLKRCYIMGGNYQGMCMTSGVEHTFYKISLRRFGFVLFLLYVVHVLTSK